MRGLFDRIEIKNQNSMSKSDKKRFNCAVGNALDMKLEYKVCHVSSKFKLIKEDSSAKFVYFEYYDKIYPTIHSFSRDAFKHVVLDSGAIGPLSRGSDVMCPGIIKYKDLSDKFNKNEIIGVEIIDQGIFAIGVSLMSYDEMMVVGTGPAIEIFHVKGDNLDIGNI